jgi:uncharacterized protein YndB with AHSA1/START domain
MSPDLRRSIRVERRVDASPDAMFAILTDLAGHDRFAGVRRSEVIKPGDPAPNGVGAVRWAWLGPLRFEEEITAFEPSRRFDYVVRHVRGLRFRHAGASIQLTPDGTGTRAVWTSSFEVPIPLVGSTIDRIFALRVEQGFVHMLERSAELAGEGVPADV